MKHFEYNTRYDELRTLVATPVEQRHTLKITDIKKGSFLKIDDVMFKVMDEYQYKYKKETWSEFKLMSMVDESIRFMEVEVDDDVELCLTEREVKIRDIGISKNDLAEIQYEDDADDIHFNGKTFVYEDNYKAKFKRTDDKDWQKCYLYEFETSIGKKEYITIEDWDGEIQVFYSTKLSKGRVEIVAI